MCDKILTQPIRFPTKYIISAEIQNYILQLLSRDIAHRLSCVSVEDSSDAVSGFNLFKEHLFFADFDWELLESARMRPPFIPSAGAKVDDIQNFDAEFTKQPAIDSPPNYSTSLLEVSSYPEFTYLNEEYVNKTTDEAVVDTSSPDKVKSKNRIFDSPQLSPQYRNGSEANKTRSSVS